MLRFVVPEWCQCGDVLWCDYKQHRTHSRPVPLCSLKTYWQQGFCSKDGAEGLEACRNLGMS